MTLDNLQRRLEACIAKNPTPYLIDKQNQRQEYINRNFEVGGKGFIDRVTKYGTTEKGIPLNLTPSYLEYLELLGDFRVKTVLTSGGAQLGKTLGHLLLAIDGVAYGKLNAAWFYASKTALDQLVPMQFQPTAKIWVANMKKDGHQFRQTGDRIQNTRYQIDGANAIFSYVSTSKRSRTNDGGAAVGGVAASFQADFLILEERSQYGQGEADVTYDRIANSLIATKPVRQLGTPGGGMGIELEMANCDYRFYPYYKCTSCDESHPLDPKGCVLKTIERQDLLGNTVNDYLSESGRPVLWWHSDSNEQIESAYIGCANCGHPIDRNQRTAASYQCRKTGVKLRDLLDSLPTGIPTTTIRAGIELSPLSRESDFIATDIIRKGLEAENSANWQQQTLGHPSQTDTLHVTIDMIRDRIGADVPTIPREFRLCGIDVGRAEDWLVVIDYYLPPLETGLTLAQIFEQSIRVVIFGADVVRSDIPELLDRMGIDYGLIDNEPSRESSINLARSTCLDMGNQTAGLKDAIRSRIVEDGGMSHPCWDLRIEKFMLAVYQGFTVRAVDGEICYRLPQGWDKWIGNPTERSPLLHLAAPWRDSSGKWQRGKGNLDDFYMAFMFTEAAFYLKLLGKYGNPAPIAKVSSYSARN